MDPNGDPGGVSRSGHGGEGGADSREIVAALRAELTTLDAEPLAGAGGIELAARRAAAVDRTVVALAAVAAPFAMRAGQSPAGSKVALLAVGGYGQRELTPGSDVDLLFVHGPGDDDEAQAVAASEALLYPLWDAGVAVSHAVRTPAECRERAEVEIGSLTTLLGLRLLAGPPGLAHAVERLALDLVEADPAAFVLRLRESRRLREERFGAVWRTLDPDLKDGLGGLRDARALSWFADLIPAAGFLGLSGLEIRERIVAPVRPSLDALLLARTALHRLTGTRSTRLTADHHAGVAGAIGVEAGEGWEARDVLMRDLAAHARWVDLVLTTVLERTEDAPIPAPGVRTILAFRQGGEEAPRVDWEPDAETTDHPDRSMATAQTLRRWARFVERLPADRWPMGAADALVELLLRPDAGEIADVLAALAFFRRLVPGWVDVEGRPQRDPYHRFPVDAHLLATAIEAGRLLTEPGEPFLAQAATAVDDPAPLLLGALLHDIGKVGRRSHVDIGTETAEGAVRVMGLPRPVGDEVVFLVREHLLLADTATRRNLEDEDLVLQVAARVGNPRRLAMLYLVTVADATATGPSAFTPWRMGLIRDLVAKVQRIFEHGQMDQGRAGRLAEAEARVRAALSDQPHDRAEAFMADVPPSYLLWTDPILAEVHLPLLDPAPDRNEVRIDVREGRLPGTTSLTVVAADRLGLLSNIAGALTLAGLSIVSAQAFTTETRLALDAFEVRGAFEDEIEQERWIRFEDHLSRALAGELDLAERVRTLREHYRPPGPRQRSGAEDIPVTVAVDDRASDFHTVIEVGAADRIGLLFDLTRTFASFGLDVHAARVATYGPRVVDVFYVTDAEGQKVTAERAAEVERVLRSALEPG